jgi:hypothetical protein
LENYLAFNPNLSISKGSARYNELRAEAEQFVAVMNCSPLPKGLRPAIARYPHHEKRSWACVFALLANLHQCRNSGKKYLAVSMSPNTYSRTAIGAGIINLIKLAEHCRLLRMWGGYFVEENRKYSRLTRIKPTDKLIRLLVPRVRGDEDLDSKRQHIVELRYTKRIVLPNYQTKRIRKTVPPEKWWKKTSAKTLEQVVMPAQAFTGWYNLVYRDYDIRWQKGDRAIRLNCDLVRIYDKKFTKHGRFYMRGLENYQSLNPKERETVTINGYPTEEYDYKGLHIRILYALAGQPYPLNKDPYGAVLETMGKDAASILRRFPTIRDDLKNILLALVHGTIKNKRKQGLALRRANYRLFNKWSKVKDKKQQKIMKRECTERKKQWRQAGILDSRGGAKDVLSAFYEAHRPIKHYFFGACPKDLFYIDSQIANYILAEMMVREYPVPTLPLHDSFRTISIPKYIRQLKRAMKQVFQEVIRQATGRKSHIFKISVERVQK